MHTCSECGKSVTEAELASGRCPHCGISISATATSVSSSSSADFSSKTSPEFNATILEAPSDPSNGSATEQATIITDIEWSPEAEITHESQLPEPMRSIADPDRTIGMNDEVLAEDTVDRTLVEPDRTLIEDSAQSDNAGSATSGSGSQGGGATRVTSGTQGTTGPRMATADLSIHPRLLSRPGATPASSKFHLDYEIVKKLGEGGMGEVWLANQMSLNREVAVKQIRGQSLEKMTAKKAELARQSFLAEAVVTGDLNHPNIVPVYDMGTDFDGNLLYSMKCVRGTSWDRLIQKYTLAENIEVLRKVSDAIAFAHSRGVVHRDLKPSNIMVGDFGEVLVMDWGTALPLPDFSKAAQIRSTSGRAGTPAYMPPEQAEGEISKIGPHSDVYLLGAILFEIVTGLPPHPIRSSNGGPLSTRELLENAFMNRIVPTTASGELLEIAMKAMRSVPAERHTSAAVFIAALKNYQQHAESVVITSQAKQDLKTANATLDYSMYARSVYGFENALQLWNANSEADRGLTIAKSDYAQAALKKQDFDLGLSQLDGDNPDHQPIHAQLIAGRDERNRRAARLRATRRTLLAAAILFVMFITGSLYVINDERSKAVAARIAAEKAADAEKIAKQDALNQKSKAEDATREAIAQRMKAEQARQRAVEATKAEEIAKDIAEREWYYAQINLADQQVTQNAFDSAREILASIEAKLKQTAGGDNPSNLAKEVGWEYQRLKYVCGLSRDKLESGGPEHIALTAAAAGHRLLGTANLRGDVEIWTSDPREKKLTIKVKGNSSALAFSPSEETVAVGNTDGLIELWNTSTGQALGELRVPVEENPDTVTRILYVAPDLLVSTSLDHRVRLWNASENKLLALLKAHTDAVLSVASVVNNNKQTIGLVTGDGNRGEIRYWKWPLDNSSESTVLTTNESSGFSALAAQVRGEGNNQVLVFAGTTEGNLKLIEFRINPTTGGLSKLSSRSLIRQPTDRHQGSITSLLIDPTDPDQLISTGRDNTIRTWNIAPALLANDSQTLLKQILRGHGNAIVDAAIWKDEKSGKPRLLTASADGTARLWNPDEFPEVVSMGGGTLDRTTSAYGEVSAVSVGGTRNERIMGISSDGVATIWDVPQNAREAPHAPIRLKEGHRFLTQAVTFIKDFLITISFDGTAAVWSTQSGSMIARWPDVGTVGILAASADGSRVITGYDPTSHSADEANLQIWSLAGAQAGRPIDQIRQTIKIGVSANQNGRRKKESDLPSTAAISPSGDFGLVGTENGYVNLIHFATGRISAPIPAHEGSRDPDNPMPEGVTGIAFLSDADVATSGLDGTIRFWRINGDGLEPHPTRKPFVHVEDRVVHRVIALAASADGRRLVTRLRQGKLIGGRKGKNPDFRQIWVIDVGPDSSAIHAKLQQWGTTADAGDSVASVAISPDGDRVLATVIPTATSQFGTSPAAELREWSLSKGGDAAMQIVMTASKGFHFQQALYLPLVTDQIAIVSDTLTTVHQRTANGDFRDPPIAAYGPAVALQACDVSQDGTLAVTVSDFPVPASDKLHGEVRVWKINGTVGDRVGGTLIDSPVRTIAMSPTDSSIIVVAGSPARSGEHPGISSRLFRWTGKELVLVQEFQGSAVIRCRFSADGKQILMASRDGQVRVLKQNDGDFKIVTEFNLCSRKDRFQLGGLIAADLSEDGTIIVAADKNSVGIFDARTSNSVIEQLIQGHSSDLTDARFATSADGPRRLWTTSLDGTVKFWGISQGRTNAASGDSQGFSSVRSLLTLRGHQRGVLALAALLDGGVVSAGKDGRVILWPIQQSE